MCNFPTLVILILIILQFSKGCKKDYDCDDEESRTCCGGINIIDNGVLFIIALFFLSCSGCGKGAYGTY
ncbi:hypothetical protein IAI10_11115 [Clostridium sp. 19966]|nr:hypothetical protein [Clostridium sp. 19966]